MNLERENILVLLNVYQERVFISYMPTHPDYLGVSQMRSWGPFLESPQYFSARKAVLFVMFACKVKVSKILRMIQ